MHNITPTTSSIFYSIFKRHIQLILRKNHGLAYAVMFVIVSLILFKITTNSSEILYGGAIQFIMLFSILFSLDEILYEDYNGGMLEQLLTKGVILEISLISKIIAHTIILIIPFVLILPIIAYVISSVQNLLYMFMSLLLMSINALLILTFCSSLYIGYNKSGPLLFTALPFTTPSVVLSSLGMYDSRYLWWALALSMFVAPICVWLSAMVIRYMLKYQY